MNEALAIGAAALRAEQRALETHANNVANINTPAFKRLENSFAEVVAQTSEASLDAQATTGATGRAGGSGVKVDLRQMLFEQGDIRSTGNALDLAIDGNGFIELLGARGETLLWRGGRLKVDSDGLLATESGTPLRAAISIPYDATELSIAANGVVSVTTGNDETVELGQIGLVSIESETAVERLDGGLFRLLPDSHVNDLVAGEEGAGRFAQGAVETSNVELTDEMVQLMIVQRAYAANAQIVQAADQLASITNNLTR